jgi:polyisoprenyl-phosphate glycosyltransferase
MQGSSQPLVSVIIPCFNDEQVILHTYDRLANVVTGISDAAFEFILVDDGSSDRTVKLLRDLSAKDDRVRVIALSRNFGHSSALTAGLEHSRGAAIIIMDSDLQDPPETIPPMLALWRQGNQVVYGQRTKRKEGLLKRFAYGGFYRLLRSIAAIDIPLDAGDFCLMDRRVVDELNALPERNRYIRGLRAWLGFTQTGLIYERQQRFAGDSNYSLSKLVKLAFDGIFNFSIKPIHYISGFGFVTAFFAVIGLLFILFLRITDMDFFGYGPADIPGFSSIILTVLFFGGVQLISLGIIGEYLGRVYEEVKARPKYVVKERAGFPDDLSSTKGDSSPAS